MKSYCRQNAFTNWYKCRLTFRRQAFVTTCLGSTTSTRGSLMATLRMQLMSNPYTFSHPVHTKSKPDTHVNDHAHNMCFLDFFFFLQFSGTSKALFSLFLLSCQHKKGSRENKTERLTLPGRTVPLSFCLSRPYVEKDKPSRKYTLASSSTSSRMSGILVLL